MDFCYDEERRPAVVASAQIGGLLLSGDLGSSWQYRSSGICPDVHAVRPDPFNRRRLYALTGSGALPGGLYRSSTGGQRWRRLFGYRYCMGLAISAYARGDMVVVAADRQPPLASKAYIFRSCDAGRNWCALAGLG